MSCILLIVHFLLTSLLISIKPSDAQGFNSPWMSNLDDSSHCYPIPPNMKLCSEVGYEQMFLPNFLYHDDVKEAIQQSNIWVSLVKTNCHPDLKRFLCSLYAPVCVKGHPGRKIPPCQRLCLDVKESCLPLMKTYGFNWPDIVKCEKFTDTDLCIPPTEVEQEKCSLCDQVKTYEGIASKYCLSDLAMKAKIRHISTSSTGSRSVQIDLGKRQRFFKTPISQPTTSSLSPLYPGEQRHQSKVSFTSLEAPCSCPEFSDKSSRWLVMGRQKSPQTQAGPTFEITYIVKWDKSKNNGFNKAVRDIRKQKDKICHQSVLTLDQNNNNGVNIGPKKEKLRRRNSGRKQRRRNRRNKNKESKNTNPYDNRNLINTPNNAQPGVRPQKKLRTVSDEERKLRRQRKRERRNRRRRQKQNQLVRQQRGQPQKNAVYNPYSTNI